MVPKRGWVRVLVPAGLVLVALGLRVWGLGTPSRTIGDEGYYAVDAENYIGGGVAYHESDFATIPDENTWMHPPLVKELLLVAEGPMSQSATARRLVPALTGTVGVLLLYFLALELWGSVLWAAFAAGALALDGLHIVLSRMTILDVFATTFVTGAFLFLVRDIRRATEPPGTTRWDRWFGTRDRGLAGLFLGLAIASKWSALTLLPLMILCVLAASRQRTSGSHAAVRSLVPALVALPVGVYLVSYLPFWIAHGPDLPGFARLQFEMLRYHLEFSVQNRFSSPAITWPILQHPIVVFPPEGIITRTTPRIVELGNPALWWGFLLVLPPLTWIVATKRRATDAFVLAGYLSAFVPWLIVSRTSYLYYMLPAVPFMCLGVVAVLRAMPERLGRWLAPAVGGAIVLAAVAFLPLWLGFDPGAAWLRAISWLPRWN
jgi:dolichyl-phosphate-mannose--protein O-mannosyl transferase